MNLSNVTAVLITREKEYPKEIDKAAMAEVFGEVMYRTESPSVYERYLGPAFAKNDIIYVQDDDCIVDYKELWKHYNGQLTNFITAQHEMFYRGTGATLVGWGCFFPKSMLSVFDKYIEKHGTDAHLLRDADRIFTVLNQPHNTIIGDHVDFAPQVGRMWNEPNHWSSMSEAIEKAKALIVVK